MRGWKGPNTIQKKEQKDSVTKDEKERTQHRRQAVHEQNKQQAERGNLQAEGKDRHKMLRCSKDEGNISR
jgi:hypothetical protein